MKKIMWFWILPLLLLVVTLVFSITLPVHSKLTYKTEIDNKAYEQKINFKLQYESEGEESVNRLNLLFRDGELTQHVDYFVNEKTNNNINIDFENNVRTIYKGDTHYSFTNENCEVTQKQLEQAPISYRLSFYGNHYDYYQLLYDEDNKDVTLHTDLKYTSGNDVKLVQFSSTCEDMYTEEFIEREIVDSGNEYDQPLTAHLYKGYYYVMPTSDKSMSGQNKIYKIKITEKQKNGIPFYEEEIVAIVNLEVNRYYTKMIQHDDYLYVVSSDDEKTYITQYSLEGQVKHEIETDNNVEISDPTMVVSNGYLIMQTRHQEKEYYSIYDKNTLAFIKEVNAKHFYDKNSPIHLLDIKYEEGELYLLYKDNVVKDGYDDNFTGRIVIGVANQDTLLYKGSMQSILNEKTMNYNTKINGYFMEVE